MSVETMIETSLAAGIQGRPLLSSPHRRSPSPPTSNSLASHLLAAVSQVQSLTSHLPISVPLPSGSPPLGGCGYRPVGLLGTTLPQLHMGVEPPMSSLLAGLKDFSRPYHSPPPLPSSENHECKIVEYRGSKVASFIINCDTMLCLPQAFEIFLKHLVGGLHTVYTKLKRLGIEPIVCNVDQVRILRGLGAIQPGVNRCKLLSIKHFDILYRDCTTASSRPGRPPKRASDFMSMGSSPESIFEMKKRHLENGSAGYNGHIHADMRLDKSPLLANGYHAPPHFNPLQYMANHMAGLGYPPFLPGGLAGVPSSHGAIPHPISPPEASPMKQITPESLARLHEERVERERQMILDARRGVPLNSIPSSIVGLTPTHSTLSHHNISSVPLTSLQASYDDHQPPASPILNLTKCAPSDPANTNGRDEEERNVDHRSHNSSRNEESRQTTTPLTHVNHVTNHNSSNLSSSGIGRDEDRNSDMDDDELDKDESMDTGDMWSLNSSTPGQTQLTPPPPSGPAMASAPLSSTEVLLRNILGLLRVAEENARHHERQTQYEKAELKMEVLRERELRETLEKQLQAEQKNRVLMQKRCAKLKKLRRRLQERLDIEVKRRSRYEDHLRSASPEVLSDINGSLRKDMEAIAAELHQESLHPRDDPCIKDHVDVLMSSAPMTSLPAITAASITTSSWQRDTSY